MSKKQNTCLAIQYNNNIVKYAKVTKNSSNGFELKEHGVVFVKHSLKETLETIIKDTDSTQIPVITNILDAQSYPYQIFKQVSQTDMLNTIKLEFEDWCEHRGVNPDEYAYVSLLSDVISGDYKKGVISITEKTNITDFSSIKSTSVASMQPTNIIMSSAVPKTEKDYILLDIDDKTTVTVVIGNKVVTIDEYEVGMSNVLKKFEDILGSYQKAYDACKQINVFTEDDYMHNKVQLEEILEPILQEIFATVSEIINKNKELVAKILVTGKATLFTNIDTLITEYFALKCEILRAEVQTTQNTVKNIADVIEVTPSIALASEFYKTKKQKLDFLLVTKKTGGLFKNLFSSKPKSKVKGKTDKNNTSANSNGMASEDAKTLLSGLASNNDYVERATAIDIANNVLSYAISFTAVGIISYIAFSNVYLSKLEEGYQNITKNIDTYVAMSSEVQKDIDYVSLSMDSYASINNTIETTKNAIEQNEIGKFSTYNVASFMQKIIKIIPEDLVINNISSDDNKNITITATAEDYETIGYFVANLRLSPDLLGNIEVKNITNGEVVTVEIGGELP